MKNKLVAILLLSVLVLSVLVFCIFGIDYKITATAVAVWAGVLLLRPSFPRYFGRKYTLYAIYFVSLYVLFYVAGLLSEEYLEYKVYQFDINHDLIFSPEEQTAEWQTYWDPYIGDGARRVFRPIMTFFYSLAGTLLLALLMWLSKISRKPNPKQPKKPTSDEVFFLNDLMHDDGKPTPVIRASISFLSAEEGSRKGGALSGYKPNHNFGSPNGREFYVGEITFDSKQMIHPGETCEATVRFIPGPGLREKLHPGQAWRIQEGGKLVATGKVLEVIE